MGHDYRTRRESREKKRRSQPSAQIFTISVPVGKRFSLFAAIDFISSRQNMFLSLENKQEEKMSREKALHNNHHYYDYCCGYPCVKMISFPFFFSRENFCTIFIFNAPFLYRVDVSLYDLMTTTNVVSVHC